MRPLRLGVWAVVTVAMLLGVGLALEHQITWYLAVDQFGYVRFANDLLDGRFSHEWPPAQAIAHLLRDRTDMLAQTYVWDQGTLYSRYAPGFPILLAGWILLFGDLWAHYLNPTLFVALLAVVIAFQWELTRSPWRGTTAAALIFLCPTYIHLWGLTLTRDMSAHVFGVAGLTLLLSRYRPLSPRRVLLAGALIGYAGTIRPDAVMYLIPAAIIGAWRWSRSVGGWRELAVRTGWGAAGVVVGLLPSLIFYGIATGNPFVPTQAMELRELWSRHGPAIVSTAVAAPPATTRTSRSPASAATRPSIPASDIGFPSPGWHGGTLEQVQGGGLKVRHLRDTIRGNWGKIRYGYGRVLVVLAAWGALVAIVLRPMFAAAGLTYIAVALLFFSMWTRPDSRYLIGVWVLVPMFIVEGFAGTLDLVRWLWRRQLHELARGLAVVFAVGSLIAYAMIGPLPNYWRPTSPMPTLTLALVAWGTLAGVAAAIWPGRRLAAVLVPVLMLTTTAIAGMRIEQRLSARASFQRAEAQRARLTFRRAVTSNGVVITSEDVGRPMENIEYYADRRALYLTDLTRWRIPVSTAAQNFYLAGMQPYLLLQPETITELLPDLRRASFEPTLVVDIPPRRNYDYFVAAPFHRGLPMQLWRLDWPLGRLLVEELRRREARDAAASARSP